MPNLSGLFQKNWLNFFMSNVSRQDTQKDTPLGLQYLSPCIFMKCFQLLYFCSILGLSQFHKIQMECSLEIACYVMPEFCV